MRLVPTPERVDIIGFSLAKARIKHPGVQIIAVCQMSNHMHLVLRDRSAEVSGFMQYFLGHLAKRLNRLDGLRGTVFERRFAQIAIVDEAALVHRVAYAIANPVEANLVRASDQWTGLCAFAARAPCSRSFTFFHEARYERVVAAARGREPSPDPADFHETAALLIDGVDDDLARAMEVAVRERQDAMRSEQGHVLGAARATTVNPLSRPTSSSRSAMPLCFASTRDLRRTFAAEWRAFVSAYREASSRFRLGWLTVAFPAGAFRPSTAAT